MEGAIGQVHGNYDCHGPLGSVSMVFTIYGFMGLIYSSQPLRLAPNRPCRSLVLNFIILTDFLGIPWFLMKIKPMVENAE